MEVIMPMVFAISTFQKSVRVKATRNSPTAVRKPFGRIHQLCKADYLGEGVPLRRLYCGVLMPPASDLPMTTELQRAPPHPDHHHYGQQSKSSPECTLLHVWGQVPLGTHLWFSWRTWMFVAEHSKHTLGPEWLLPPPQTCHSATTL